MKKIIQKQKGSAAMWVIAIVVVAVVVYLVGTHYSQPLNCCHGEQYLVKIMVPADVDSYKIAMAEHVQVGGPDPLTNTTFISTSTTPHPFVANQLQNIAEAAAEYIQTQAGTSSLVTYFKVVNGTAYVVLNMDENGWAGVSVAIAEVHPIVEKSLLAQSGITAVKFGRAPGDSVSPSPTVDANGNPLPILSSVSPATISIGTKITVNGSHLAGFEGDKNLWISNSAGQKGIIYGDNTSTDSMITFTLANKYCTSDTSYSGAPCPSYLTITPGTYSIVAKPWANTSNALTINIK